MATDGAWRSEYFDKTAARGPGSVQSPLPPATGPQVTPPPGLYNISSNRKESKLGRGSVIVSVVLRLLTLVLAVVAVVLVVLGEGTFGVIANGEKTPARKTVRFTILGAGKYLFVACLVVAVYSLALIGLSIISLFVKFLAKSKTLLWITFLLDQVLAYALISAGAAAANAIITNKNAENITGYTNYTNTVSCQNLGINGLCTKASAAVALAFLAFLFLAVTSILSARRLFRH